MTKTMGIDTRRAKWVERMGLRVRHTLQVNSFIDRFVIYDWPANGIRKRDHTVVMTIYEDGSFATALDDGCLNFDDATECLQAMALASETLWEKR